jgi:hypothetical protein
MRRPTARSPASSASAAPRGGSTSRPRLQQPSSAATASRTHGSPRASRGPRRPDRRRVISPGAARRPAPPARRVRPRARRPLRAPPAGPQVERARRQQDRASRGSTPHQALGRGRSVLGSRSPMMAISGARRGGSPPAPHGAAPRVARLRLWLPGAPPRPACASTTAWTSPPLGPVRRRGRGLWPSSAGTRGTGRRCYIVIIGHARPSRRCAHLRPLRTVMARSRAPGQVIGLGPQPRADRTCTGRSVATSADGCARRRAGCHAAPGRPQGVRPPRGGTCVSTRLPRAGTALALLLVASAGPARSHRQRPRAGGGRPTTCHAGRQPPAGLPPGGRTPVGLSAWGLPLASMARLVDLARSRCRMSRNRRRRKATAEREARPARRKPAAPRRTISGGMAPSRSCPISMAGSLP